MSGSRMGGRPWLCPEPRCTPLLNLRDGDYRDITIPEPGQSFFCWGAMDAPVSFVYDGVEHTNDANGCTYTPLKGLIRFQENAADWNGLASYYRMAGDLFAEHRAALRFTPEAECPGCKGTRWTDDENWQGEDYDRKRRRGYGRIPCGFCNEGGWDVPDGAER